MYSTEDNIHMCLYLDVKDWNTVDTYKKVMVIPMHMEKQMEMLTRSLTFRKVQYKKDDFPRYDYQKEMFEEFNQEEDVPVILKKYPLIMYGGDVTQDNMDLVADGPGDVVENYQNTDENDIIVLFLKGNENRDIIVGKVTSNFKTRFILVIQCNHTPRAARTTIREVVMSCLEYRFIEYMENLHKLPRMIEAILNDLRGNCCFRKKQETLTLEMVEETIGKENMDCVYQYSISSEEINITVKDDTAKELIRSKFQDDIKVNIRGQFQDDIKVNIRGPKEQKRVEEYSTPVLQGASLEREVQSNATLGGVVECGDVMYGITCYHCCQHDTEVFLRIRDEQIPFGHGEFFGPRRGQEIQKVIEDITIIKVKRQAEMKIRESNCVKPLMDPKTTQHRANIYEDQAFHSLINKPIFLRGSRSKFRNGFVVEFGMETYSFHPQPSPAFAISFPILNPIEPGDSGALVCFKAPDNTNPNRHCIKVVGVLKGKIVYMQPKNMQGPSEFCVIPLICSLRELRTKYPDYFLNFQFYNPT